MKLPRSPAGAPRWMGLRRSAIIEVGSFLTAALVIDLVFRDGTRFAGMSPHPFWAIIGIVAAQYGTYEGLFAWAAATAVLLVGNLPTQSVGEDSYAWLAGVASLPTWWLGTSLVLGALTDRHRRSIDRLDEALQEASSREAGLAKAVERLTEVKESLEIAIAGELNTASAVVAGARAITRLDRGEVVLGVGPLVSSILNPEKFSVYLLEGTRLEAVLKAGWLREDRWLRSFSADSVLFQAIVGRKQTLAIARAQDEALLGTEGVLAGPLIATETGEVFGMLKIERLGFSKLTPATVHTFRVLCEWIGESYRNARQHELTVTAPARPYSSTSLVPFSETGVFKVQS